MLRLGLASRPPIPHRSRAQAPLTPLPAKLLFGPLLQHMAKCPQIADTTCHRAGPNHSIGFRYRNDWNNNRAFFLSKSHFFRALFSRFRVDTSFSGVSQRVIWYLPLSILVFAILSMISDMTRESFLCLHTNLPSLPTTPPPCPTTTTCRDGSDGPYHVHLGPLGKGGWGGGGTAVPALGPHPVRDPRGPSLLMTSLPTWPSLRRSMSGPRPLAGGL